jgi:hypothetical protein
VEQARQQDGDAGGDPERRRQQVALGESEGRDADISEIVDDQVEALAAPARQHLGHPRAPGQRPVNGVDDERDAEPDERSLPVAMRSVDERQQGEGGAGRRQYMHRSGAKARTHAATGLPQWRGVMR